MSNTNLKDVRKRREKWNKYAWLAIITPCVFFTIMKLIGVVYEPFRAGGRNVEVQNKYAVRIDHKFEDETEYAMKIGSDTQCQQNAPLGAPSFKDNVLPNPNPALFCYDKFTLLWDSQYKTPLWGSYVLDMYEFQDNKNRFNATQWLADPNIANASPKSVVSDVTVKQARMIPMPLVSPLDFGYSKKATEQASYTTNLIAVYPNTSQAWLTLNKAVHGLIGKVNAREKDVMERLIVVSGVSYKRQEGKYALDSKMPFYEFGTQKIAAPNYLYKAILHPRTGRSVAFIIPNYPTEKPIDLKSNEVMMSIQEMERRAGVQLFPVATSSVKYKNNTELLKWF